LPSATFLQQLTQALAGQPFDFMIVAAGHALIVHPARSRSLLRSLEAISSWISFCAGASEDGDRESPKISPPWKTGYFEAIMGGESSLAHFTH